MSIVSRRTALDRSAGQLSARLSRWRDAALLESGPGFGEEGRWSVLAAEPRLVFEMNGDAWTVRGKSREESGASGGLDRLARLIEEFGWSDPDEGPPFAGGWIGYYGYDLAPRIERLPRSSPRDGRLPDVRFGLYDTAVVVDHDAGTADLWAFDLLGEGGAAVERRLADWLERLAPEPPPAIRPELSEPRAAFSREEYQEAVARTIEYIAAGDIFQANLSQRFACDSDRPIDAAWVFERLKARSPAPYSALLRWDDLAVVSASPELFYRTEGRRIVTRPIKGTRPRGGDEAEDRRLADELRGSLKDRAELTMIVDLERNDLGRVCEYGSVRVVDPMSVESFAQVHHLVATVEGRLRPDVGPVDVVRAVFPGGSITGAPKIRAMEIIDSLEPNRRSAYTGAIGYYSRGGRSVFNIAIRTILVEGTRLTFQVGGGIVADSTPEGEYRETLHKAAGIRLALRPAVRSED